MFIELKADDESITIVINGAIEMVSIRDFKNKLFGISYNTEQDIKIDLNNVPYIDSYGMSALLFLLQLQRKKGKKLILQNACKNIRELIELCYHPEAFELK